MVGILVCINRFPTTAEFGRVCPFFVFVGNKLLNAHRQLRMATAIKQHGRVYTPDYLVKIILDFGKYNSVSILQKHVIDNSCGDGAFLSEIVNRYCSSFLSRKTDLSELRQQLETYIHGIELDANECDACVQNLNKVANTYGLTNIHWNVVNADTLTIDYFNGKMDYVFGNPPYVRVHNLNDSYDSVKKFTFADGGMTDLFIVFFEIGFRMLTEHGTMCLITPSSWLNSLAGKKLREYIFTHRKLSGVIDLEHLQPFSATTYTLISCFENNTNNCQIDYYTLNDSYQDKKYQDTLTYSDILIGKEFYFSHKDSLTLLRNIKTTNVYPYVSVKNGFATLADKVFIGDFDFSDGTIKVLKSSTGKWSKCIYPYDEQGYPLLLENFMKNLPAYEYLLHNKEFLTKGRDIENDQYWYLFGRTQALKDVSKIKYAVNTIIKDVQSVKLEFVPQGCGVYSGLYILTAVEFEIIQEIICSEEFVAYVKLLKKYKSGGYYTYSSKDLEQYLNYKLTDKYGQSKFSNSSRELF